MGNTVSRASLQEDARNLVKDLIKDLISESGSLTGSVNLDLKLEDSLFDRIHEEADSLCIYTNDCWNIVNALRYEFANDIDDSSDEYKLSDIDGHMQAYAHELVSSALIVYTSKFIEKLQQSYDDFQDNPVFFDSDPSFSIVTIKPDNSVTMDYNGNMEKGGKVYKIEPSESVQYIVQEDDDSDIYFVAELEAMKPEDAPTV